MYRLSLKGVVPLAESASILCLFVCLVVGLVGCLFGGLCVHKVYPYYLQ